MFIDANAPVIRKKIKKFTKQEPYESRVVWKHLTEALEKQDSEAAAEAKHAVRQLYVQHICKVNPARPCTVWYHPRFNCFTSTCTCTCTCSTDRDSQLTQLQFWYWDQESHLKQSNNLRDFPYTPALGSNDCQVHSLYISLVPPGPLRGGARAL